MARGSDLSLTIYPDPSGDRAFENVCDVLTGRGARRDGTGTFVHGGRPIRVGPARPAATAPDERAPVRVLLAAEAFSRPESALDATRKKRVVAAARQATALFAAIVDRTRPLYGAIDIDTLPFPTPAELRSGRGDLGSEFFVRRDLLAQADLGAVLTRAQRTATEWPAGTFFASWWPFAGLPQAPFADRAAGNVLLGRIAVRADRQTRAD
ncbi:hypothetical protein [Jidongwangia harbinensis]|uniref:hypothetical protein n=1 Tax=Jidongwangia harbinensis TaxID=2878561 RepID=UPI001CD94C16|nr:hypothetical protein [Jidongwangia harbinensis]MCA2212431.1 hypothetical protein [Jidongwangia harbinensis]